MAPPQPPSQRLRELVDSWRKSAQTHDNYAHYRDEPYDDVAHEHRVKGTRLRRCADELEAALAAQEASPQPEIAQLFKDHSEAVGEIVKRERGEAAHRQEEP